MRKKIGWAIGACCVLAACVGTSGGCFQHLLLTGHLFPIKIVEHLKDPVPVTGWTAEGLIVADGRTIPLPGVRGLPGPSAALSAVTQAGAEVACDGRVYGLVRIHHWCGNDPVSEHLARVDIACMLRFLSVGEQETARGADEFRNSPVGGSFSKWGWEIGEYELYRQWLASLTRPRVPTTQPGSPSQ